MLRGFQFFASAAVPLFVAFACTQPFQAVGPEDSAGGAADAPSTRDGLLGSGSKPGVVSTPSRAGAASSGGEPAVLAAGGAPSDVDNGMAGADAGAGTGAGGAPSGVAGACPKLGGEKLVLASGFCIDESEVTVAHYLTFVASHPSLATQPAACAENLSFSNGCTAAEPEKQPERCVDWCDAHAYCESVGKHLCGSGSAANGAMPYDASATSTDNQWYAACSHDGELAYPYGDTYDTSACWGADRPPVGALTVKSASGCVGGYGGLWDMSGGVAEWVDSCNAEKGMSDACRIRGGSFSGTAEQLRCDWQSATPRSTTSNYIGFRCCADVVPG